MLNRRHKQIGEDIRMFWILLGALAVLFIRNNFNAQGVAKDIHAIVRAARRTARELGGAIRQGVKDGKREAAETHTAETKMRAEKEIPVAEPVRTAEPTNSELLKEMEQNARTAAMLANVPTIAFPEDDPKYDSARKYMYA